MGKSQYNSHHGAYAINRSPSKHNKKVQRWTTKKMRQQAESEAEREREGIEEDLIDMKLDLMGFVLGTPSPQYYHARAELLVENGKFGKAAECYEIAGEPEKAKECYIKVADTYVAKNSNTWAAAYYEKAGMKDKAKECYIKAAEVYAADEDYTHAIESYKRANLSLATLPRESQEKLLGLIREGNVEATQGLALLVKNEEEELIFNEARAGLVL
jgi:tetratricopeptide (TPR) repeat protein